MKWYVTSNSYGDTIVVGIADDYVVSGIPEKLVEYQAWLAEGNTPEQYE